jgi:ribonuclease VapC
MMQVVDSSVVLAYILDEPGGDVLMRGAGPFLLSSVNLTEVLTKLIDYDLNPDDVMLVLQQLPIEHAVYDRDDARSAADLRSITRMQGLSLGDRACLALARRRNVPVLTADTVWTKLDIGLDIRLIR